MADWSLPTLTSTYTNFATEVKNRDVDLALQFDGTTSTNLTTGTIRWSSTANRWQKWSGTAWAELTSTYALTGLSTTGSASIGTTLGVTGVTTLTGGGTTTTAATDNNSTTIASTAFVVGQASATAPVMDGTATVGTSLRYARQDHVHPTDTSRAPLASPTFTGTVTIPAGASISGYLTTSSASSTYAPLASPGLTGTPTAPTATTGTNTTQIATTAFVVANAVTTGGGTLTGDLTVPSLNSDSLAGTRSRIMNGGMQIDQRNTGSSISSGVGAVTYCVDRWYVYATGAAVSAQRVTSSNSAFTSALRIIGAASNTGVSIGQRIEVQNSYDMAGKTVTLSFYAASSASVTLTWKTFYAGAANDFTTKTQSNTGTQSTNSTLTKYSATFTLSSSATTGVAVEFSVTSLTSGSIDITGVQLELGSVATPFERRSFGQELALCQRYYEVAGARLSTNSASTGVNQGQPWKVSKRASPTVTFTASTGTGGTFRPYESGYGELEGFYQFDNHTALANAKVIGSIEL